MALLKDSAGNALTAQDRADIQAGAQLGPYANAAALAAAFPAAAGLAGVTALVGGGAPYDVYLCDGSTWGKRLGNAASQAAATLVSAGAAVAASRNSLASDSGAMLELANGVVYTLVDTVALPLGVTWMGPMAGTATLAVNGTDNARINGGTTSIVIWAGQVYVGLPRATNAALFIVKGG